MNKYITDKDWKDCEQCKDCQYCILPHSFNMITCKLNTRRYTGTDDRFIGLYGEAIPNKCENATKPYYD